MWISPNYRGGTRHFRCQTSIIHYIILKPNIKIYSSLRKNRSIINLSINPKKINNIFSLPLLKDIVS